MPTAPNPQPAIVDPIGVFGSLIRILKEDLADPVIRGAAPLPNNVNFDERPAQQEMYPVINVKSDPTNVEYAFERNKTKTYIAVIEVYGVSLADAELLGEAVERSLERGEGPNDDGTCAARRIASLTATDPDCISILDIGGESYRAETDWSPSSQRTHMGTLRYAIEVRRSFT